MKNHPSWLKFIPLLLLFACHPSKNNTGTALYSEKDVLHVDLDTAAFRQIKLSRDKALTEGVLMTTDDDWQKATIRRGDESYAAELRLKGDWPDHLRGTHWSYRIRLKGGKTFMSMNSFAIQLPHTRDNLSEWFFHQWLQHEDILTTWYDFIPVSVNNDSVRIYAIEEFFDKTLVEKKKRREGPILKFDEESMWESRVMDLRTKTEGLSTDGNMPTFETAGILPFKISQVVEDPAMRNEFDAAQSLMSQYQKGNRPIGEIFDLDKMARYYAILDLTKAYHALLWHNQRMYFNPIIQKLEPIGYDGFTDGGVFDIVNRPFIGYMQNPRFKSAAGGDLCMYEFLRDQNFVDAYAHYLHRYSQPAYLDSLFNSLEPEIKKREQLIALFRPGYQFDRSFIRKNAIAMLNALAVHGDNQLKAFNEKTEYGKVTFTAINQYILPVRLLGISLRKDAIEYYFEDKPVLPAYNEDHPIYPYTARVKGFGNYLFYQIPGYDSTFITDIREWQSPAPQTPEQNLFSDLEISSNTLYSVQGDEVRFRPGRSQVKTNILIPAGYQVYFGAGTQLDFVQSAAFISLSPVYMLGTADNPVKITSSDSSANGFTVLQAAEASQVEFTLFDHLSNLNYKGWTLSAAVCFYESNVNFRHSSFLHSQCEDAVNVVRSEANLDDCHIAYTWGDGFDSDFSHGLISKCTATHTTNDAFDVSTSKFRIEDCDMIDIGDKGVSCGEQSIVEVSNCRITKAPNGVVAKDLSQATVDNLQLSYVGNAFAAYMKKTMWGPGHIQVHSYTADHIDKLSTALDGSTIELPKSK